MPPAPHSRRDFLSGRAALGAAVDSAVELVESILDRGSEGRAVGAPAPPRGRLVRLTRRAMACDFEVVLNELPDAPAAVAEGMAALDLVERVEDQLTVYRDHSEVQRVNRAALAGPVEVEAGLFGLLELCGRVHAASEGAFDPTSGPLSRVWGFARRAGATPDEAARRAALDSVGWPGVALDPEQRTVRFLRSGAELNFNSSGKGYALDRVGESLAAAGVRHSLTHGGRSTLLARGSSVLRPEGGWLAGLRDPTRPERRLAEIVLRDEALSTSGSGTQFFVHNGKRRGHLIDPRTGWPAEGLYSATVVARSAAEADALSTAAYVLGVEGTERLVARWPGLRALLLAPGEGGEVAVHAFGFVESDWRVGGA